MTERERRLLAALAWMARQYLSAGAVNDELDNQCISAGEMALEALAEYGLVTVAESGRCGSWTAAGSQFLISN